MATLLQNLVQNMIRKELKSHCEQIITITLVVNPPDLIELILMLFYSKITEFV